MLSLCRSRQKKVSLDYGKQISTVSIASYRELKKFQLLRILYKVDIVRRLQSINLIGNRRQCDYRSGEMPELSRKYLSATPDTISWLT